MIIFAKKLNVMETKVTKEMLRDWCSDYCNCYYVLIDGSLENTGDCPGICDEVAEAIDSGAVVEEVTERAEEYHRQLGYEVRRNDCRLFSVRNEDGEIVVAYYGHRFS